MCVQALRGVAGRSFMARVSMARLSGLLHGPLSAKPWRRGFKGWARRWLYLAIASADATQERRWYLPITPLESLLQASDVVIHGAGLGPRQTQNIP